MVFEEKIKLKVYCGHNKTVEGLFSEPTECCWEDIVEVDAEDYKDGSACVICPSCNAELWQDMQHFEKD